MIADVVSGERLGMIGEYKKSVRKNFKTPEYIAGFELDTDAILRAVQSVTKNYQPLSRYPSTERDICFQVKGQLSYAEIAINAKNALNATDIQSDIVPVDIYQAEGSDTKNITIRIKLTPTDHTLTSEETTAITNKAVDAVVAGTHATVI